MTPDWMREGACRGDSQPDRFFPEGHAKAPVEAAKAVCQRCSVSVQCLEYALTHEEVYGVWGGMSERERRALKAPRPVVKQPSPHAASIRRLAGRGWTDPEIARHIGLRAETVQRIRARESIPAGKRVLTRCALGWTA